jgi:hypothetical protein
MKFLIFILFSIFVKKIQSGGPAVSPSPRIIPSICDSRYSFDIYSFLGVPEGSYVKTACFVSNALNFSSAFNNCAVNGMELLKFGNNSLEFEISGKVVDTIYAKLKDTSFNHVWINGQKDSNGIWRSQPGNGGLESVLDRDFLIRLVDQGNCLQLRIVTSEFEASSYPKPIGFAGEQCAASAPSYCEFKNI